MALPTLIAPPRLVLQHEYRLGNRNVLEWVIDQYQLTEDKRSGIRSDPNRGGPNRADDPEYIVWLVGQVMKRRLETVRLVASLLSLKGAETPEEPA